MRLLTVGDSFTYGEELDDLNNAWPHVLGRRLGYEVTNLGQPGAGNTQMIRNVIKHAPEFDLVVVAWSHWARTEFADSAGVFDIWPGCNTNFHKEQPWRKNLIDYYTNNHNDMYLIEQFLINIVLLQSYLKSINKRYVMLTAFGTHNFRELSKKENLNLKIVDYTHYIGWPNKTMMEWTWGSPQGPNGHFLDQGHQQVADKIYEYIRYFGWIS